MKYFYIVFIFLISLNARGQNKNEQETISFDTIINRFQKSFGWNPMSGQINDTVTSSSLFRTDEFNVSISEDPISFNTEHLILKNPFFTDDYEDFEDRIINYPISYSVIYKTNLISLFDNGKFVSHDLHNYSRDLNLEKKLNTKKFRQHWVFNGNLYAHSKNKLFGRLYKWNGDEWVKSKTKLPVDDQPILFGDDEFIVFRDCHGEWGGSVYFYERATKNIYFTESTCTNTVTKVDNNYFVLAQLGHMMGTSEIKLIEDPRKLRRIKKREIAKNLDREALDNTSAPESFKVPLELFEIQLFSTFHFEDRQLFIAHLNELTFLAEIKNDEIKIVHPLFNNGIYTHNPVTKTYGNYHLVNIDHYGTALDREVSVVIIEDSRITLLEWNENHSPD